MNEVKKFCADCKTTKTPLWRTGPHGPRSLCNACGIRYRKRKMVDDKQPSSEIKREKTSTSSSSSSSNPVGEYDDHDHDHDHRNLLRIHDQSLKMKFTDLDSHMIVQSSATSQLKRQKIGNRKKKLGEVEQAAALLMSLSCGSVFA